MRCILYHPPPGTDPFEGSKTLIKPMVLLTFYLRMCILRGARQTSQSALPVPPTSRLEIENHPKTLKILAFWSIWGTTKWLWLWFLHIQTLVTVFVLYGGALSGPSSWKKTSLFTVKNGPPWNCTFKGGALGSSSQTRWRLRPQEASKGDFWWSHFWYGFYEG